MGDVMVSVSARTDIGRQRAGNEDSYLIADLTDGDATPEQGEVQHRLGKRGTLLVVSDGMGGAAGGEVASELAVATVREALVEFPQDLDPSDRIILASQSANSRIWNHARDNPELTGMGATLTAALVQDDSAYIAQVGDSRAYLLRGDEISQVTKDQSWAQLLVEAKLIDPEHAGRVAQNVIMQALGTQREVRVTVTRVEISSEDCILLCSDGLSNKVTKAEMLECVREESDLSGACERLVDLANERGGEDNITVIIARFDGEALRVGKSIDGSVRTVNEDFFSEEAMSSIGQIPVPAAARPEQTTNIAPPPETGELELDPADLAPGEADLYVPDEPVREKRPRARRMQYDVILLFALISVLLLAAAAYFVYVYYVKQPAPPNPIETGLLG